MSRNPTKTLLAAWMLVAVAAVPTFGQDLHDMQPFAPVDASTYGGRDRPDEGFFITFDGLIWSISAPGATTIGFEGATREVILFAQDPPAQLPVDRERFLESNTHTTGLLNGRFVGGERWDIGYTEDHSGWLFSGFNLHDQTSEYTMNDMSVVFSDPPFGPSPPKQHLEGFIDPNLTVVDDLPVLFEEASIENVVEMWGLELNYTYRLHPFHRHGTLEFFLGARYLEFDEKFSVDARGGTLADSFWDTTAENHLVGPQLGGRWLRKNGRWSMAMEGRFFAAYNSQDVKQQGVLGTELDPATPTLLQIRNMNTTSFSHAAHDDAWAPGAELRIDLMYQLTRSVSARVGWTGFFVDGIARAPNVINYEVPAMGIDLTNNHQSVFTNGVTIGVVVNRN